MYIRYKTDPEQKVFGTITTKRMITKMIPFLFERFMCCIFMTLYVGFNPKEPQLLFYIK